MKHYLSFAVWIAISSVSIAQERPGAISSAEGNDAASASSFERGHVSIAEVRFNPFFGKYSGPYVKLNLINGYQVKRNFSVGIGTGFKYSWHGRRIAIPFFADFRGTFSDKPVSPYWSLGLGYTFDASNKMKGQGLLINPAVGVRFKVSDKTHMNVGVGYERQRTREEYYSVDSGDWSRTISNHSLEFHLGFTF